MSRSILYLLLAALVGCSAGTQDGAAVTAVPCPDTGEASSLQPFAPWLISEYVTLRDGRFAVGDTVFTVRGVNYYPARYPWRRFLTQADMDAVGDELLLLRAAGFNTLRIFLWNAALFSCEGRGLSPNDEAFFRLDNIIQEAAAQGFRLILTLNDLPDEALYSNPDYVQA